MKRTKVFETATNTYTETGILGEGGTGLVYRVVDIDGSEFAIKCLKSSSEKLKRFQNELHFCRQENHRNIVQVIDDGALIEGTTKKPFFVMPLYGGTLRSLMREGIKPSEVLPIFDQVLSGVDAAHLRGIIHRDLKPENILWDSKTRQPLIADFGIARFSEEEMLTAVETKDQERLANFMYAAPEQKERGQAIDSRADIFALGLILNEMFTRRVPLAFGYPLIGTVAPDFTFLDEIVGRMLRHSPSDRYPSIGELKKELVGRGHLFVVRQKLDDVSRKVVPVSSPDDPLGGADVKIIGVEYEPGGGLYFRVEPEPPPKWLMALHDLRQFRGMAYAEPSLVEHDSNGRLRVRANEEQVPHVIPFFKEWVTATNTEYRGKLTRDAEERHAEEVRALKRERARIEEKERVNSGLGELF